MLAEVMQKVVNFLRQETQKQVGGKLRKGDKRSDNRFHLVLKSCVEVGIVVWCKVEYGKQVAPGVSISKQKSSFWTFDLSLIESDENFMGAALLLSSATYHERANQASSF